MKYLISLLLAIVLVSPVTGAADAESSTHDTSAAEIVIEDTYRFSGGELIQFNLGVLAQYSYILSSGGEAVLVDPLRTIEPYLKVLNDRKLKLKAVFLTHSHADFVAGHIEASRKLKVPVYISALAKAQYPHTPLTEASVLSFGTLKMKFLATPGHTPEGMVGAVYTKENVPPELLLTGDTLFVGSVGRPDLLGANVSAAWLAGQLYESWNSKLKDIGDGVRFYPAHGAGSLCGANLSDASWSTIGEQKKTNPFLQIQGRNEFISAVINGLPEAPQYFAHNAHLNRIGPKAVIWDREVPVVTAEKKYLNGDAYSVVDIRPSKEYISGHIKGSLNIALRGRLETWVGTMVPFGKGLYLVSDKGQAAEAARRLHNVGYEVVGRIDLNQWKEAGLPLALVKKVTPKDLRAAFEKKQSPVVVDVRQKTEYTAQRIGNILNYPLNHLKELSIKLEKDSPVVTVCNSAYRSSMAIGILQREGFTNVSSLEGGRKAWEAQGYSQISETSSTARFTSVRLPDRMSAQELNQTLLDLPGSVEIIDLRPQSSFEDYSVPGSVQASPGDVLSNPSYLTGEVPLVLVCRDGSISMAVGGALSQLTQRRINVLYGGVSAFWDATRKVSGGQAPASANSVKACPYRPQIAPGTTSAGQKGLLPNAVPKKTAPKKRRSAGC
jgi:rhodanese-related sulfurtransferase/glyoxylase-like metal-dependent hydrolase (beta-lactamase superfamily II)